MNQLVDGLIAGIIGSLIVLVIGLIQKRRSKLTGEPTVGKEWNRFSMALMFCVTGFLPLTGLVLGIIGLFLKSKRKQGMFLLFFMIGVSIMYVLDGPEWGLIFGVFIAICCSIYFNKYTPQSIGIAILLFIVLAISYDVLVHTDYAWNTLTYPLGWKHPH